MESDSGVAADQLTTPPEPVSLRYPLFPVRATYVLIALNVLVFLPTFLFGNWVYWLGGLIPQQVLYSGEVWRFLTAGFIHGDVVHLLFNMYALHVLGRDVERIFGSARFLAVYFLALLGGNILVVCLSPLERLTVGASGAILGLLGALVAYFWRYRENLRGGRQHLMSLISSALLNLGLGLLPRISLWGHLGGIVVGLAAGIVVVPVYIVFVEPSLHLEVKSLGQQEFLRVGGLLAAVLTALGLAFFVRG